MCRDCFPWCTLRFTILLLISASSDGVDLQGPIFIQEPSHRVEFSNISGGKIDCTGHGSPTPEIDWVLADGSPVHQIPELRIIYSNGSLVFPAFPQEKFRHDIHTNLYKCRLRSNLGSVLSRDVHVKAVVKQSYDVQVYDEYVISGNTAVLKCKIPSYVAEYVMVTSWIQDGTNNIYPNTDIGGKYIVLGNGDLYISNAGPSDGYKNYACRTVHRLTGEIQLSTYPGRVIITEPKGSVQPRITVDKYNSRRAVIGGDVTLPCVAQGHPVPEYHWSRELQDQTTSVPVALGERISLIAAGLLKISKVRLEDRGVYICHANNSAGEESVRVTLEVTAPLSAHMQPQTQTVDVGREASFHCVIGGYPVSQVAWLHNAKTIVSDAKVEIQNDLPKLTIKQLSKEDKGMYQCVVSNNWDQAEAIGELNIGDAGPELTYWFSEQTLQPGPTVSLKCVASGAPPPRFTWSLDGFPIPDSPRFLVGQYVTVQDDVISHVNISNIKAEDGGEYTCTAQNSVGKVSHSAKVNVYGLPFIREMPKVVGVAGMDLVVKCPVAGYPIETISWERDGQILPINRRQKVFANGTLVIEQTQPSEDAGTYTCQVQNKQRNSARRNVEIRINVPPKILPINPMTDVLREGMRAPITCQIMEGDLPITFRWERNGKLISNNISMGTSVRRIDEFSSSLILEKVTSMHSGNYTCIASNVAGVEKYTVPLSVNVPPRWTVEPSDSNVASGKEAVIHCQAEGYPHPTITWRKAVGEQHPGEYKEFIFDSNIQLQPNGSIIFKHVSKNDESHYLCEAKNNIGSGVSKVIYLKVNAPAHFPYKTKQVQVVKGEQAHLQCSAVGDTPMEIIWRLDGQQITDQVDKRYDIREQILAEGMVSELGIERTIRQDTGTFTCFASNAYGQDEMNVQLIVQEIPEPPKNVRVTEQLSRSIGLLWSEPYSGNSPIINYIVQYKLGSDVWPTQPAKVTIPGTETATTLENLQPAQNYHIRILAENRLGLSEPSQIIQVNTLEEAPSGSPTDIRAEAKSSTELVVTWEPPPKESWNGNLLGYHVGYQELPSERLVSPTQGYVFKTVDVRAQYSGEAVLQGLAKFTSYNIIVQAYNSRGSGPASEPIVAQTLEDAPTLPPENVQCSVLSAQSLHISWEPPLPGGQNGIIQGYKVTYHSVSEWTDNDDQQTKVIQATRTTVTGLKKYTNYSITVLAYTSSGDGIRSLPIYCHTEEDVPSAPADIKAVPSALNKILVSWLPPKHSNGPLAGYTFYMSSLEDGREAGTHKKTLSPTMEMHEVTRSQETATYQFWVSAFTKRGEGESTHVVTVTPSSTIPAKIASFGREIVSAWKQDVILSCKSVGIPLPEVKWMLNELPLEIGGRRSLTPDKTLTIKDVQRIDQANYSCHAENKHGRDIITYWLKILVPPDPPILRVVETHSDSVHLRWTDQRNGESPILGYVINYKRDHGDWEELQIPARTDEHILRNLWCGTKYLLYITAINRIGTGLPCDIVTAYTKGTVPIKPKQSQLLTTNATTVTIWLDSWGDGGCGILYFMVEYKKKQHPSWLVASNHIKPNERIYSIPDLWPATEYELRITALNNAGETMALYNFTTLTVLGVEPEVIPPVSHSEYQPFYANTRVILPISISIGILLALIATIFWRKKIQQERSNRNNSGNNLGESPSMAQIQNKQNRDQQYLAVRVGRGQQPLSLNDSDNTGTYKTESADYIEDICPYATFQLSKPSSGAPGPYSESSYSGNIYSGPYHSVRGSFVYHDVKPPPSSSSDKFKLSGHSKEPEYTKVRRKGGRLRDPHSESQEYDTLGSDSEGDAEGGTASQELMSFRQRIRGGTEGSTSSSETSPPSGSVGRKPYHHFHHSHHHQHHQSRKNKGKQSSQLSKRHVRSSSGYSSHNEETTFSISHAPSFNERINPPSRFSDISSRDFSEPECEKTAHPNKKNKGMSKLNRETFQINV
ncbi:Down syndrome cell adhesion molecule-like protein Dscam2 isoform X2 [Agrilus planipennis]|uniref:Down syndrome cell adhesion molecule-like protein Dscam2 isoform X2 n=1 Tax=Agrilus planipennis TaxID=224129 RepID=A0A7F5R855_AGRPL|nr:Down syndrome cell adhesion molecule-like protein Dscam2 isoform X2 [Agrilus planipennis]